LWDWEVKIYRKSADELAVRTALRPTVPARLTDLGIPKQLVIDLILRYLWLNGSATLAILHGALKLSVPVVETVFRELRQQQILEVKGMVGNDYSFTLSNSGHAVAGTRSQWCQYCGAAPVSIAQYREVIVSQADHPRLDREYLREAFHDLVLPKNLLDQLGAALAGRQTVFLYGETGSGKTSIAERLVRIYSDSVLVPYAVEVDGHIITVFDAALHEQVPEQDEGIDPRWVLCRRPCMSVGGEFCAEMLELRLDAATRVFIAPTQMKANNGVLVIDDFGRQLLSPRDLLNRWITALDRRVDYLTLVSGMKFQVPFELLVVFSTNLNPRDLADEAFLRRIQAKILVENASNDVFDEIFRRVANEHCLTLEPGVGPYLRKRCYEAGARHLRACYPSDICRLLKAIGEYENRPVRLDPQSIDRAVDLYFAKFPTTSGR
jgi:predicted ATPase with chaperone activity